MLLRKITCILLLLFTGSIIGQSIVDTHGRLRVQGNKIVDQSNNPISIAGNSLFWSNADDTANYYNAQTVNHLADDWNSNLIRCAMGVNEPWDGGRGYINSPNTQETKIRRVIDAAIAKGIYVIIDWHTHEAEIYEDEAVEFFTKMARIYGDHPNIIYEVYNEPINQSWNTIKNYAEAVIAGIRSEDPDNLIIVGTPFFSQRVDIASQDPINDVNTAYTLHFYAGTHGNQLRNIARTALNNGVALFVTEWGTVNADGNGNPNNQGTQEWMSFLRNNDISHTNWAVSDKNEGASIVRNGNGVSGLINGQLTSSGNLVRDIVRDWGPETSTTTNQVTSEVNFTRPSGDRTVQEGYTSLPIEATGTVSGGTISRMRLFINNQLVRQENIAPYEWGNGNNADETLGLGVGTHNFRVVMRDSNGNFSVDRFVLTVTPNQSGENFVNFTSPSGNRTVQLGYNSLQIEAVGNVNNGNISRMSLLIDGRFVRQEFFAPYEWGNGNNSNETLGLGVGNHTIRVIMRDNNGNFYDDRFTLTVTPNQNALATDDLSLSENALRLDQNLKLFPNPASTQFSVDGLPRKKGVVTITDMLGRIVHTQDITSDDHTIDITNLRRSNYIVMFVYDDAVFSRNLVKIN